MLFYSVWVVGVFFSLSSRSSGGFELILHSEMNMDGWLLCIVHYRSYGNEL